jgi:spore maturation protein CgeB
MDVFFYGYGSKFRADWMEALIAAPSRELDSVDFAVGGRDFNIDLGRAREIGDVTFNAFARTISSARVNLCITRKPHATVRASSSCRPFELASAGAAIVSNPYDGLEQWFEPGSELLIAESGAEAVEAYRLLLDDPAQAEEMGRRARQRVLDEHTYRHRARQILDLAGLRQAARVG